LYLITALVRHEVLGNTSNIERKTLIAIVAVPFMSLLVMYFTGEKTKSVSISA
jgi:hypothetical protein